MDVDRKIDLRCFALRPTTQLFLTIIHSIASGFALSHHGNGIHLNACEYILIVCYHSIRFLLLCNLFFHKEKKIQTIKKNSMEKAFTWFQIEWAFRAFLIPVVFFCVNCTLSFYIVVVAAAVLHWVIIVLCMSACLCMHIRMRFLHIIHMVYAYTHHIEYI